MKKLGNVIAKIQTIILIEYKKEKPNMTRIEDYVNMIKIINNEFSTHYSIGLPPKIPPFHSKSWRLYGRYLSNL